MGLARDALSARRLNERTDAAMFACEANRPQRPHGNRDRTSSVSTSEQEALTVGELRAWRGLLRAHACLAKRLDAELERRAPPADDLLRGAAATSTRRRDGRMRMCDLAEQAQLSRSGLTRLVDRLEREALLERCSCEHDARGAYACLTDGGSRAPRGSDA